jgi:hypothetical protein
VNVRNLFVSGIPGIKNVKTSGRVMVNPSHKEKIDKKIA